MGRKKNEVVSETLKEANIYDKYTNILKELESGSVKIKLTKQEKIEILRYVEKRIGHSYPTNLGCSKCFFTLLKLFNNLKNK